MDNNELMLKIENVSKIYRLGEIGGTTLRDELQRLKAKVLHREDPTKKIGAKNYNKGEKFKALDNISFEVKKGERIGIIGHNGAGKSTLLKLISRVTGPTEGKIYLNGRVASMLEVGTGFHPELTGRENVYMNGAILGMTKKEIDAKMEDIIEFSEVRQFIDTPVKRYSSGMYVKLAFSVAAHLDSEIMIMDEVLAVGDVAFQNKCLEKMREVSEQDDRTILYVSHNMNTIKRLCNRVIVLSHGAVVFDGDVDEGIQKYTSFNSIKRKEYIPTESNKSGSSLTNNITIARIGVHNNKLELGNTDCLDFEIEFMPKTDVHNVVMRLVVCGTDGTPVRTFYTKPKNYQYGCKYIDSFKINASQFSPGNYCFKIILFSPLEQNVQLRHESLKDVLYFTIIDEYIYGLKWQQSYWGNAVSFIEPTDTIITKETLPK